MFIKIVYYHSLWSDVPSKLRFGLGIPMIPWTADVLFLQAQNFVPNTFRPIPDTSGNAK